MDKTVSGGVLILVAALAIYYQRSTGNDIVKEKTLTSLLKAEKKAEINPEVKIAVGFGACYDIFVNAIDIFKNMNAHPPQKPEHVEDIMTQDNLEKIFTYFFEEGAAAERYIGNGSLFEEMLKAAKPVEIKRHLGGNAPVMASRFAIEGSTVMLGASITDQLRKEIHPKVQVVGNKVSRDDIHLIMEYKKDEEWEDYTAPRANRFIVHHDENNAHIEALEKFTSELQGYNPSLLVVGGLQMMDNYPFKQGERQARLQTLQDLIHSQPRTALTHFEMASFAEEECFRDVIEYIVKHVDSLGMNEQELPNLYSMLAYGNITLISDAHPRIATTLDQMRKLYTMLRQQQESTALRPLTRLHIHTLAYQAIMTTKGSAWKNTMSAAAKASLTANRHVCGSKEIDTEKAKILMDEAFTTSQEDGKRVPFYSDRPVSCWEEEDLLICIAPNLVCTEVVQTAGGGDNISSAGLVLQI